MDCSPPGYSVHGILQARTLEWVAISFSRGSSWPRDQTWVSRIAGRHFTVWAQQWNNIKNNEKNLHVVRIIKRWQRDRKWANAVEKNGSDRLVQHWVGTKFQFIKNEAFAKGWSWNLQYFAHLMWRADSLEKTLMLAKIEGKRRRGHHWLNGHESKQTPGDSEGQGSLVCCIHGVAKSRTWLSSWTTNAYMSVITLKRCPPGWLQPSGKTGDS